MYVSVIFVKNIYLNILFLFYRWYKASSLPEPRTFACAATLNREIFLWGGQKDALNEDGYLLSTNSVLVYNSNLSKWEHHMTVGTMKHATAIAKCGKLIYQIFNISCIFMNI